MHLKSIRLQKLLRKGHASTKFSKHSAKYITSAVEVLLTNMIKKAGRVAKRDDKTCITTRHIQDAIGSDPELTALFTGVIVLPRKKVHKKKKKQTAEVST